MLGLHRLLLLLLVQRAPPLGSGGGGRIERVSELRIVDGVVGVRVGARCADN